jgi:hypothetical protein
MSAPIQVKSLDHLIQLALDRKSVVVPTHACFRVRQPAAWIQNLQARMVHSLLSQGKFIYEPIPLSRRKAKASTAGAE